MISGNLVVQDLVNGTMLNTHLLRFVAQKYLKLGANQHNTASSEVLCPEEIKSSKKAIYLDQDLDRVISPVHATTMERETTLINGENMQHGATIRSILENATLLAGHVYSRDKYERLTRKKHKILITEPRVELDEAFLGCTWTGNNFFAHWLIDDLPLNLSAPDGVASIRNNFELSEHQRFYSGLFGVSPVPYKHAFIKKLFITEDLGQTSHKAKRYQELRSRIRKKMQSANAKGVVIKRGSSGRSRGFINEDEIIDSLIGLGFDMVDVQTMDGETIATKLLDAKIIIGVDGSHLAHGLLTLRDGGVFIVIQPPVRFFNIYKSHLDCMNSDLNYGFIVGNAQGDGFTLETDRLYKLLDKVNDQLGLL